MLKILGSLFLGVWVSAQGGRNNFGAVNLPTQRNFFRNLQVPGYQQSNYNQLNQFPDSINMESDWRSNLINLFQNENLKCAAKALPGQHVTFDPVCLDKRVAQTSNGGLGCIEEQEMPTGCRYCEFDVYSAIPCNVALGSMFQNNYNNLLKQFQAINTDLTFPSVWRTKLVQLLNNEKAKCAAMDLLPGQRVGFDPICLDRQLKQKSKGGLGCYEEQGMPTGCRYCEFDVYSEIPCDWTQSTLPLLHGLYAQGLKSYAQGVVNPQSYAQGAITSTFLLHPATANQGKLVYWLDHDGGHLQDPVVFSDDAKIGGATKFFNGVAQLKLYKPLDSNARVSYKTWDDSKATWGPIIQLPLNALVQLPHQQL